MFRFDEETKEQRRGIDGDAALSPRPAGAMESTAARPKLGPITFDLKGLAPRSIKEEDGPKKSHGSKLRAFGKAGPRSTAAGGADVQSRCGWDLNFDTEWMGRNGMDLMARSEREAVMEETHAKVEENFEHQDAILKRHRAMLPPIKFDERAKARAGFGADTRATEAKPAELEVPRRYGVAEVDETSSGETGTGESVVPGWGSDAVEKPAKPVSA